MQCDGVDDQAGHVIFGIVGEGQVFEVASGRLRVIDRSQDPGQVFVRDHAGEPVAGHQEPVARPDVELPDVFGAAAGILAAEVEIQARS